MLIRRAGIWGAGVADLRIEGDRIAAIGDLPAAPGERVIHARGGALLPGLHDHHLHLMAYAASLRSVSCGPPEVTTEATLAETLRRQDGHGWLRGFRYHESVAGDIDRHWLDRCAADRPVRIQHRSGRLWIVNSAGLALLREAANEEERSQLDDTGRLYDHDALVGRLVGRTMPPLLDASRRLAAMGVTGITDMTPDNDAAAFERFRRAMAEGMLVQRLTLAGTQALRCLDPVGRLEVGATKIHLHESALPPFADVCATMARSHEAGRPVAVHCVTEVELVFTLAALAEVTVHPGDRIEHASVTPPALLEQLRDAGLTVVTQPNFIAERGDAYLEAFSSDEIRWLYRCRGFLDLGIPLAGGTDAPFGDPDPWRAMRAAVTRTTGTGRAFGLEAERLTPEAAVDLFLGAPATPATPRRIEPGAIADLCLLAAPWSEAREALSRDLVAATFCAGRLVHDRVDQAPVERSRG